MNFLQLCQRARLESGLAGSGPTAVTGQAGILEKIVAWVSLAYEDIQASREDWQFMHMGTKTHALSTGKSEYTPTEMGLASIARWDTRTAGLYTTATGVSDEQPLSPLLYDDWRDRFGRGEHSAARPQYVTIKDAALTLLFSPEPDDEYTFKCDYYRDTHSLADGTDEPLFAVKHHMIIVNYALMHYGVYDVAPQVLDWHQQEYHRRLALLERQYVPEMRMVWEPIA